MTSIINREYFDDSGWNLNSLAIKNISEIVVIITDIADSKDLDAFLSLAFLDTKKIDITTFDGEEFICEKKDRDTKSLMPWIVKNSHMSMLFLNKKRRMFLFLPSTNDYWIVGGSKEQVEEISGTKVKEIKKEFTHFVSQENKKGRDFFENLWNQVAKPK